MEIFHEIFMEKRKYLCGSLLHVLAHEHVRFYHKKYIFFSSSAFEENPDTGCYFVGRGGLPNSSGILECDAAVMTGKSCCFGAVAALQG